MTIRLPVGNPQFGYQACNDFTPCWSDRTEKDADGCRISVRDPDGTGIGLCAKHYREIVGETEAA